MDSPEIVWQEVGRGRLATGDCRQVLATLAADSIDVVITDPPYNYEFVGKEWNHEEIQRRIKRVQGEGSKTLVKNLPYGSGLAGGVRNRRWYQKNRDNALDYEAWTRSWGEELYRVCKPGAYLAVFNATRFLARVQVALEDCGFYPRDIIVMRKNSGIPRGLNPSAALMKQDESLAASWRGYHSALRNQWEGVVLVQKPLVDNYINTVVQHGVGLMRTEIPEVQGFTGNIHDQIPSRRSDPEISDLHATPKPLEWMTFLIDLLSPPSDKAVVLDPFIGTGTTAVAAEMANKRWIGIDLVPDYIDLASRRVKEAL